MRERTITYKGTSLDIRFTVDRCTHVAECLRGSPEVFDTRRTPWIIPDNDQPDKAAEVIISCPTGALHFTRRDGGPPESPPEQNTVRICRDGPLYLHGDLEIRNHDGTVIIEDTRLALCRCGESEIMPLCDGTHDISGFYDKEGCFESAAGNSAARPEKGRLTITLIKDGPLNIRGPLEIRTPQGTRMYGGTAVSLCRCGKTDNPPFCDGSHLKHNFTTGDRIKLYKKHWS